MRISDEDLLSYNMGSVPWGSLQAAENIAFDLRDLRKLARALINKLEEIERSPEYRHVWENNLIHGDRQYQGPVCKEEVKALKSHLEGK